MLDRWILHMDLDSFFVSVERLLDNSLEGKPVIVGGNSKRGVVSSCSYEARAMGVHSAMPTQQAYKLCPNGIFVNGSRDQYVKYSRMVTEIILANVPIFEKASIDEFYIDLTGMDKHYGVTKYADFIREKIITETGLPISYGLASSKTVAKIATGEAKPNNAITIAQGEEMVFLAPLPIKKIPMAGKKACEILQKAGLTRIKQIQQKPLADLEILLGKSGHSIWHKARGLDKSIINTSQERKSISAERTFEENIHESSILENVLQQLVDKIAYQLRNKKKMTTNIAVKIRFADFKTKTLQRKIECTAADHIILPIVKQLFSEIRTNTSPLRLIGIRLGDLVEDGLQFNLFSNQDEKPELYNAIDTIRKKYGTGSLSKGSLKK